VVQRVLKRLEERGLAKRHKQGVYLIERSAAEEVLSALRQWI
jgi:predicted transcriptional regulator of viral defense system